MALTASAQATDKADADRIMAEMLAADGTVENWHAPLIVAEDSLDEVETGVYKVRGTSFQVASIRSDFYVVRQPDGGQWEPLYDGRFPMEVAVNLLLNRLSENRHTLELRHHQYGHVIAPITLPMQRLYDLLARNQQIYCSVTHITAHEIRATVVFHQQRMDYIHLLEVKTSPSALFDETSTLQGDFYSNIPQGNVKSLFENQELKHK